MVRERRDRAGRGAAQLTRRPSRRRHGVASVPATQSSKSSCPMPTSSGSPRLFSTHRRTFSRRPRTCGGMMRSPRGAPSQRRITGSDRSCSYLTALRLAVTSPGSVVIRTPSFPFMLCLSLQHAVESSRLLSTWPDRPRATGKAPLRARCCAPRPVLCAVARSAPQGLAWGSRSNADACSSRLASVPVTGRSGQAGTCAGILFDATPSSTRRRVARTRCASPRSLQYTSGIGRTARWSGRTDSTWREKSTDGSPQ